MTFIIIAYQFKYIIPGNKCDINKDELEHIVYVYGIHFNNTIYWYEIYTIIIFVILYRIICIHSI